MEKDIRKEASRAALERYKSIGVKEYELLSAEDENTCEQCRSVDGKRFDIHDASAPLPPLHPGCRCTVVRRVD